MKRYDFPKQNIISEHIKNVFEEGELDEKNSIDISDKITGGRKPKLYNLDVIISVGYIINSDREKTDSNDNGRMVKEN